MIRDPHELADRMIGAPRDPALVRRALLAGAVLRAGFELLRCVGRPGRPHRPAALRSADLAALAGFRPGDRIVHDTGDASTDLAEHAAAECRYLLTTTSLPDFWLVVERLTLDGLRQSAAREIRRVLGQLSPARLARLRAAVPEPGWPTFPMAPPTAAPAPSAARARRLRRQALELRRAADGLLAEAEALDAAGAGSTVEATAPSPMRRRVLALGGKV